MPVTVYGLSSSENGKVRYIGQTIQPLANRLRQHLSDAKLRVKNRYVCKWIRSVFEKGFFVEIKVLQKDATLHVTETELIKEYKDNRFDLVNLTSGGEGTIGYKPNYHPRPDLSERNRSQKGTKRKPLTSEHKAKVSLGNKGKKHPLLAERNKLATGKPGRQQSDSERQKRSDTLKGRIITPEWREKLSIAAMRRNRKEVTCANS